MPTDGESTDESVDGIEKIPSANGQVFKPMSSKTARAVREICEKVESSGSESNSIGSDKDMDRRRVCVTTTSYQEEPDKDHRTWQKNTVEGDGHDRGGRSKACYHCGSNRHDDRGCWKRLTCQKCVRKGHPSNKCFFVCSMRRDTRKWQIPHGRVFQFDRKWYVPTKHDGMFLPKAGEMLY